MAEKRMFTKKITDSDAFLDMPMSTQCLYFHLNMAADDEGFVNNPLSIKRKIGSSDDDLRLLMAKSFILSFDSGVIVIKHWRMHNYIQCDRFKPTSYKAEKAMLSLKEDKSYTLNGNSNPMDTECIQNVSTDKNRYRLDLDSDIDINTYSADKPAHNNQKSKFIKPSLNEISDYIIEKSYRVDAEHFFNYYESNGWKVGRNPMKSWKSALALWNSKEPKYKSSGNKSSTQSRLDSLMGL